VEITRNYRKFNGTNLNKFINLFHHRCNNLNSMNKKKKMTFDKKFWIILLIFLTGGLLFYGCSNSHEQKFVVNLAVMPAQSGTVSPAHDKYKPGTKLTITAKPSDGWIFKNWSGDFTGDSATAMITVDNNKKIVANFVKQSHPKKYQLTVSAKGDGTVDIDPKQSEYRLGTEVTLTAEPRNGQKFSKWTGDVKASNATDNPLHYTIGTSNNITAVFVANGGGGGNPEGKPKGKGTKTDPYLISSWSNLKWMSTIGSHDTSGIWSAYYKQTQDINASASQTLNGGKGFAPIGVSKGNPFKGQYDGNGYTISNLIINVPNKRGIGLFGITNNALIENLTVSNVNITGKGIVGAIAGASLHKTTLKNVHASGRILAGKGGSGGGLVGMLMQNSKILKSSADVDVQSKDGKRIGGLAGKFKKSTIKKSFAAGDVSGKKVVGGLVGNTIGGEIYNSYARGDVSGQGTGIGGITGTLSAKSKIKISYATGKITSTDAQYTPGGISGVARKNELFNCYWDTQTSGITESPVKGATGLKTAQMQGKDAKDNMDGFDFNNIWQVNTNDYPTLKGNQP
jgi:hypothetical protein